MTAAQFAALILERLNEGEGCLDSERVVGQAERDKLAADFDEARAALQSLVEQFETLTGRNQFLSTEVVRLEAEYQARMAQLKEQFDALYEIAVRVSEADNQRLAAEGEPGFQAMLEMEDALAALHRFVASSPAKERP